MIGTMAVVRTLVALWALVVACVNLRDIGRDRLALRASGENGAVAEALDERASTAWKRVLVAACLVAEAQLWLWLSADYRATYGRAVQQLLLLAVAGSLLSVLRRQSRERDTLAVIARDRRTQRAKEAS